MIKSNKGISLVSLLITIALMTIIAAVTVNSSLNREEANNIERLINDLELLEDKVSNYYLKYNTIPVVRDENNNIIKYNYSTLDFEKDAGDNQNYYIIDLKAMDGISLNYGEAGFDNINKSKDVFIINEKSHSIYYVAGVSMDGELYHSFINTNNIADTVPPSKPEIKIISGEKNEEGVYISDVQIEIIPGKDNISGIDKTLYSINEKEEKDITTLNNNLYIIKKNGEFEITIKSYDRKGNVSEYTSEKIVVQKEIKEDISIYTENRNNIDLVNTLGEKIINYRIEGIGQKLPTEYQELEYVETSGTQYIDLAYQPTGDLRIEGKVNTSVENKEMAVVGTTLSNAIEVGYSATNNRFFTYSISSVGIKPEISIYNVDVEFKARINSTKPYKEIGIKIGENGYYENISESSYKDYKSDRLQLFRLDTRFYYTGKTYYIKIYDNNVLVRDLIPCYKKENNVVGMYDLVENVFYEGAGTGEIQGGPEKKIGVGNFIDDTNNSNYGKYEIPIRFSNLQGENYTKTIFLDAPLYKGDYIDYKSKKLVTTAGVNKVIDLPQCLTYEGTTKMEILTDNIPFKIKTDYESMLDSEYSRIEYIQTTGTQYIETGHTIKGDITVEGKVNTDVNNREMAIVGTKGEISLEIGYTSNNIFFVYSSSSARCIPNISIYNVDLEFESRINYAFASKELKLNIEDSYSISETAISNFKGLELQLFSTAEKYYYTGKTYYIKIYDNNKLVRYFVPCIRNSDETIGMLDIVEQKFYINNGTGEFLSPEEY